MSTTKRSPKDFWVGLIYLGTSAVALWTGRNLPVGTGSEMGPGYFPTGLAILLGAFGVASMVVAFTRNGERVEPIAWKPLGLVALGLVLFALLLKPLGLAGALAVMILTAASASSEFRFDVKALVGLIAFIAVCCLVFRVLLGLPVPVLGTWFR
jgi:Zn-dependent protease